MIVHQFDQTFDDVPAEFAVIALLYETYEYRTSFLYHRYRVAKNWADLLQSDTKNLTIDII
ncbi:hypothetical protein Tco_1308654, partial [Tanacetum coccineum]